MAELMTNFLTNTGLNLPEHYSEKEFFEAGQFLANIEHGLQWAVGDWYNAIPWGDKQKACEKVGLNYSTARQHAIVAERFEKFTRVNNLSFGHHKAIAIEDLSKEQRAELLTEAAEFQWSSKRLMTERDTVLGKEPALPETKPVIDTPAAVISETHDNTDIAQTSENTVHDEYNFPVIDNTVDEVRNEPPATYGENKYPGQSYNSSFEANKELSNLKQINIDLVLKYDNEHRIAVRLEGDIRGLKSEIAKLEEAAVNDLNVITKLNDQTVRLKSRSGKGLSELPNQKPMESLHILLEENALLRDQVLSNPPKQWVKSNFDVDDGSICSKVALSAKEALGYTKDDYSHNREINKWLSMRSHAEIAEIIKEAKEAISSKRKKAYLQVKSSEH